jgi:hypothetical protein
MTAAEQKWACRVSPENHSLHVIREIEIANLELHYRVQCSVCKQCVDVSIKLLELQVQLELTPNTAKELALKKAYTAFRNQR